MAGAITFLDVAFAATGLYLLQRIFASKPAAPLPPGPKGLPLVGNVADLPKGEDWKVFAEWGNLYGDLMSITVLGQPIIILGSAKQAYAMLDKKSSIYSDRPTLVMGGELVGWKNTLALTRYGERFRAIRRMAHQFMGTRASVEQFAHVQELEVHRLLRRLVERPEAVAENIRKTHGAIILRLTHGYPVKEHGDPVIECVDRATSQFSEAAEPGAFLVDVMPFLRYIPEWVPGAGFQRKARVWRDTINVMADVPHAFVKRQMAAGTAAHSFTSMHLSDKAVPAEQEDTAKWAAASLYSGGADTTVSATYVFFLAMTLYPDAQAKAQAELDAVVGADRLPRLADRANLPYVDALVKEVLRWQPVGPLAIPHVATADDVHDGYLIPKGALIIPNIWQMTRDARTYADADVFRPERFLGPTPERDPKELVFGFGRRVCPGVLLADGSVWLACAAALAALQVSKARDGQGREITPVPEMTSGTISHPKPFECVIAPRSARARELILSVEFDV